ncbi:T9SS type A sorting domain-containing protein [candidate division KSB1 bacterium]|nr:T9SS type A sorting domain-containing protein [candidate division KSB1 bacterium]
MSKKLRLLFSLVQALFVLAAQGSFAQWQLPLSAHGDEQWDARFLPPGLGYRNLSAGSSSAIAVNGGEVYFGGVFSTAGGVPANNIAKWDGHSWIALGSGISGGQNPGVYALAFNGSALYVGGQFNNAGGISVKNIAKWDGSTWSALGNGVAGFVNNIAFGPNNEVYTVGNFGTGHIAKWDGTSWSGLGGGVSGGGSPTSPTGLFAVAVKGNDVYVCGNFNKAGTVTANKIAKWDGSQWSALGGGIAQTSRESINSVAVLGNTLVAAGDFLSIDNVKANRIAAWNGNQWQPLGPANSDGLSGTGAYAYDLAVLGNTLYAAGSFTSAGGQPADNIATWNGSAWTGLRSESARADQAFWVIAPYDSAIYVAGSKSSIGDIVTNRVAKFEGGEWSGLGTGFDAASLQAIALNASGEVYIGGKFGSVAGVNASRIVKWNGTAWTALGSGLDGQVRAIALRGNDVFVGGTFKNAGGAPANNIAKWDEQSWSALGNGISGTGAQVNAIAIKGSEVYVGGQFTGASGVTANNIAKWDGANWSAVGANAENGVDASVNTIAFASNGELYVGGSFTKAGSVNAKGIAVWNGASWSALGSGITGALQSVYAIVSNGDEIYIGGRFTAAGGSNSNHLAKWNSVTRTWAPIGAGVGDAVSSVNALTLNGNELIVGGLFAKAGDLTANNLAKWDGNQWSTFGSGLGGENPSVLTLAANGEHVYVGGQFTTAGKKPSFKFAHWQGPTTNVKDERQPFNRPQEFALKQNYPNPFNPSTMIPYELPHAVHVQLAIYNLLGEKVRTLVDTKESAGVKHITWDGRNDHGQAVSSGVYLYRLEAGEFRMAKRLVLLQ